MEEKNLFWHRLIDVNCNRAAEGIRVLEDLCKFVYFRKEMAKEMRGIRHDLRKSVSDSYTWARLPMPDMGLAISKEGELLDAKEDFEGLWKANSARIGESLRVIEECYHGLGATARAKHIEALRHACYRLSQFNARERIAGLYPIIDGSGDLEALLEGFAQAQVRWIQYRDKLGSSANRYSIAQQIRTLTTKKHMKLVIDDDIALAVAIGADGIHLGQEDMPVYAARTIAPHLTLGLSTHNRDQVMSAIKLPIDYLAIGPIYETISKNNPEACEGISLLEWARPMTDLPIVAIGGIVPETIPVVKQKKVDAIAAIQAFLNKESLKASANAWL